MDFLLQIIRSTETSFEAFLDAEAKGLDEPAPRAPRPVGHSCRRSRAQREAALEAERYGWSRDEVYASQGA